MTQDEVRAASEVLARAKMAQYQNQLDFVADRVNNKAIESWLMRIGGGFDANAASILDLRKCNMVPYVAKMMLLAIASGPDSLQRSLSLDIAREYGLDAEAGAA